jgi:hypothetical protein
VYVVAGPIEGYAGITSDLRQVIVADCFAPRLEASVHWLQPASDLRLGDVVVIPALK